MADLTPSGKPVDIRSKRLKLRQLELQVRVMETDIMRYEIAIDEKQDEIERNRETITGLKGRIVDVTSQHNALKKDLENNDA